MCWGKGKGCCLGNVGGAPGCGWLIGVTGAAGIGIAGFVGSVCKVGGPWDGFVEALGWPWTWRRFRRVTSSVLRLRSLCWRCTASFEEDASVNQKTRHFLRELRLKWRFIRTYRRKFKIYNLRLPPHLNATLKKQNKKNHDVLHKKYTSIKSLWRVAFVYVSLKCNRYYYIPPGKTCP